MIAEDLLCAYVPAISKCHSVIVPSQPKLPIFCAGQNAGGGNSLRIQSRVVYTISETMQSCLYHFWNNAELFILFLKQCRVVYTISETKQSCLYYFWNNAEVFSTISETIKEMYFSDFLNYIITHEHTRLKWRHEESTIWLTPY